jgi:hypothetical protein
MTKFKNWCSKKSGALAAFAMIAAAGLFGGLAHAEDFDASSTQTILTNALSVPKSTLAWGIPIILGIVLGVWAIFWLVGKLRKHVR